MDNQQQLQIKVDDAISKGVYASDVMIQTSPTGICLTFYVFVNQGEAIATSRVFLPHTTALRMSEIIKTTSGPGLQQYMDWMKQQPPSSQHTSGENNQPPQNLE